MKLFFRELGEGKPLVILHGLFGSSDNWLTQAKIFSQQYKVFIVDLRNHGQSPHDDAFDYASMLADLKEFVDDRGLSTTTIIGHSMGGKAAMNFTLAHPDRIDKLIVVDIAPREYDLEHYVIADGLAAIPIATINSRNAADEVLAGYVADAETRQFLLKNLSRNAEGGFNWKINLPVIRQKLSNIGVDVLYPGPFNKPTLFIRGRRSNYVQDSDMQRIRSLFPLALLETLETGHWVQAEKPQEFVTLVTEWLERN